MAVSVQPVGGTSFTCSLNCPMILQLLVAQLFNAHAVRLGAQVVCEGNPSFWSDSYLETAVHAISLVLDSIFFGRKSLGDFVPFIRLVLLHTLKQANTISNSHFAQIGQHG